METASQTLCLLLFPPAHQRFTTHADVRQAVAEFVNNLQTMAARHRAKEADRNLDRSCSRGKITETESGFDRA
jgi:hypothetical protein